MGNQEPLAPLGCMVLQAKLETQGETACRASEENMAPLAHLAPLEPRESQERTASLA